MKDQQVSTQTHSDLDHVPLESTKTTASHLSHSQKNSWGLKARR